MVSSFGALKLSQDTVRALEAMRITDPTPIQAAVIPDALAGRDVLGKAPTGSGKTFGFGLPLLELVGTAEPKRPRGLVLAPTRELAEQIRRELMPVAVAKNRSLVSIYGGVGMGKQIMALRKGVDVVIATPGRLMDLMNQGEVSLDKVDRVVVDEADRMADMGFLPDVQQILDLTSTKRQTVLFSATLDNAVDVLTKQYQNNPTTHSVGSDEPDILQMSHRFIKIEQSEKVGLAADVIDAHGTTMVFCRTRHGVDRVSRQLKARGIKAAWIHGGRSQNQRDAALLAFTDGRARALVATDVAARGIHVDNVACVLHYDLPPDPKDYVHRSGRTARAGSSGDVISFVTAEQVRKLKTLQRQVGLDEPLEDPFQPSDRSDVAPVTDDQIGLNPNRPKKRSGKPRPDRDGYKRGRGASGRKGAEDRKGGSGSSGSKRRPSANDDIANPNRSSEQQGDLPAGEDWYPTKAGKRKRPGKKAASQRRNAAESRGGRSGGANGQKGKAKSSRSGKPRPKNKSRRRKP